MSLYGDGHLRVTSQDARSETDILLSFRTSQSTALLLLAAGTNDFCAVMLDSGAVRVRIDLGSGEASVSTRPGYVFNDLQWHSVRLRRIQATLNLIVDGMLTNAVTPGNFFEVRNRAHTRGDRRRNRSQRSSRPSPRQSPRVYTTGDHRGGERLFPSNQQAIVAATIALTGWHDDRPVYTPYNMHDKCCRNERKFT